MSGYISRVNIIGAGLSGLSAAITLAEAGIASNLISAQPSERAQSVLAEGGINAALDTMGEGDTTDSHFEDTMKGGCGLESDEVIRGLVETAPDIVNMLVSLGVPFNSKDGKPVLRNFGGQTNKRTAYAKSSTGKMLMTALIDETRKYESQGLITRYPHHEMVDMDIKDGRLISVSVKDRYTEKIRLFTGTAVLCTGGLNGFFEGLTTGTTQNTGDAAAIAFARGVKFANLEFIQYHPTTAPISNKVMLISEAARGEGGRLYIMRDGSQWYFMEEKYPKLGNLMPRDVVSREMALLAYDDACSGSIYLDMTDIPQDTWDARLSDLRSEIIEYLHIDPKAEPVPVRPGIHYFMGGMRVDAGHRTCIEGLYAAGEAACRYHGANRLGGNSMLGAIYGGRVAAGSVISSDPDEVEVKEAEPGHVENNGAKGQPGGSDPAARAELRDALISGLGILRRPKDMQAACDAVNSIKEGNLSEIDKARADLGLAMIASAMARKESRGAHARVDYPETSEDYRKFTIAEKTESEISASGDDPDGYVINISFEDAEGGDE